MLYSQGCKENPILLLLVYLCHQYSELSVSLSERYPDSPPDLQSTAAESTMRPPSWPTCCMHSRSSGDGVDPASR